MRRRDMDNETIEIRRGASADTRSANHVVSRKELEESTESHISDVAKAMRWFADRIEEAGDRHDWTKLEYMDEFYDQFHNEQITHNGDWMDNQNGWYQSIHLKKERHHLSHSAPDDVDLVDVLEQIADCVMAGMARSGECRNEKLPDGLLEKAYANTVNRLLSVVKVKR